MQATTPRASRWLRPWLLRVGTAVGFLGHVLPSWGTEAVTPVGDYTIQNWQIEQGLPHISVSSIVQTPDGYLWVGTFNGLARFDGLQFKIFHGGNTRALGNSAITYLQVDESGALWIVTLAGGLVRLAAGQFATVLEDDAKLLLTETDPINGSVRQLLVRDRKDRWQQIKGSQVVPLESPDRLSDPPGPHLLFENTAPTWVAHQGRIGLSQKMSFPVSTRQGNRSQEIGLVINSATPGRKGGYWVATSNSVYRLYQGQLSSRVAELPSVMQDPLKMMEDGQGTLWAGQWGKGLFRLNTQGSWQRFGTGTGMADDQINCLYRDREGSLWVGTGQGGLYRFRPRTFRMYGTENGPNVVMSVTQDRAGRMWLAVNGGGVHTWAEGKLKPVTEPTALRSYPLTYSVLAVAQDAVWIGLYGKTALRWQDRQVMHYSLDDESDPLRAPGLMTPHALFEDRAGTLWLGCAHGLLKYADGRFTHLATQDGLSCDRISSLAQDSSGTLYVGTDGGGLNCLRNGKFSCYTELDGLTDNHIASLYLDQGDALWIGTINGGMNRFKDGRFATVGLRDGLPAETIGTVIEDALGNLWLGSNRGILRVNRQALNEYLDRKRDAVVWDIYGLSDGLSTHGCAGSSQPASWKAQDGRLWFSTIKGVAVVDPREIPRNPVPPPVVIEEVVADDRLQALPPAVSSPGLRVPARTHRVEFRFTGLSLAAPEKVRFRFRLDPFEKAWIEAGTRRVAHYTGIPPGRYRFQVTACNNDGVWSDTGAELGVLVLPPWWKTWWFRAVMLLSTGGLAVGWHRWRMNRLWRERMAQVNFSRQLIASQENERQRIAGEIHDALGQDLLVIASQAQLALRKEQNTPGTSARFTNIVETAKHAVQQARLIAHNLRPGLLEELGFTKAVRSSLDRAAESSGISIAADLAEVDGLLPPEFEVSLFRILQESLNNILKHSQASEAKITLTKGPASLRLVVEDNGRGFDPRPAQLGSRHEPGVGLRHIIERANMMGGRAEFHTQPGQGVILTVEIPLRPA